MMRKYLKESLHWLHLALFKPITLESEVHGLSRRQELWVCLKLLPLQLVIVLGTVALVSLVGEIVGYAFQWRAALVGAIGLSVFGVFFAGLGWELVEGHVRGAVVGLGSGLVSGLSFVVGFAIGSDRLGALQFGFVIGTMFGMFLGLPPPRAYLQLAYALLAVVVGTVMYHLIIAPEEVWRFGSGYALGFLVTCLRPFYLIPHVSQLWRSKKAADPFPFFRNSPVYWDEAIAMPLPLLSDWLVRLARVDRRRGLIEIVHVARLPHQRQSSQRALVTILVQDLGQVESLEKMASTTMLLGRMLPADPRLLPSGLYEASRHIVRVAELASDYLTRVTPSGQMSVLKELLSAVESFFNAMVLIKPPVGPAFQSAALRWLGIVKAEEVRVRERISVEPIPNPFVVGNPLMVRDHNLFKGRKDIIVAIEENIINPAQRPALLLYGRRRIGKTSTLLNLPRLLSSKFVPVFIDCQDAKWREGDEAFCYHLAASIHDALNQRALVETASKPRLERFERYAFTRLGEYLDQIEESSRAAQKQILLTFDEYEKLEDGVSASKVTTEVLNQLRTIVQHRERIVVLFSGGHRFEEMKTINWSDYLINVKTLELSFLAQEDARELITEPVPLLQYESGVIDRIIELTHCQPYLLQAVASDLVNYLNSERRMLATAADLEVAVEKVLVTVQSYFFYTWTGDCTEPEREVLRVIATGNTNNRTLAESQASLQSLCHKEILEREASGYRFSIELFRRWVLKNQTAQALTPGDLPEPSELEYADLQTTHT